MKLPLESTHRTPRLELDPPRILFHEDRGWAVEHHGVRREFGDNEDALAYYLAAVRGDTPEV